MLISTATLGLGGAVSVWAAIESSVWFWLLAVPLLAVWLFTIAFFRDPHRSIPHAPGLMVSPADGKVSEITHLDNYEGIDGPAIRIGIFLSVFDVHINRSPCVGRVTKTTYQPGEFLDARHPESGIRNEAMTITLQPEDNRQSPIIVRQIAGLIARRIICRVGEGDSVERGQRIGLIKFGSRTELIVSANSGLEPTVKVDDHVKGGATILMQPA